MNKNKGITLIALVITIIVMIILAGTAINLVISEEGTISKSENAKKENLRAQVLDLIQNETKTAVNEFGEYDQKEAINNLKENYGTKIKEIVVETNKRLGIKFEEQGNEFNYVVSNRGEVIAVQEYICEKDVDGVYELLAPVPLGFVASDYVGTNGGIIRNDVDVTTIDKDKNNNYIIEQNKSYYDGEDKIEYGLVIYQGNEKVDENNVKNAVKERNQFVWIPVKEDDINSFLVLDEKGDMYYLKDVHYDLAVSEKNNAIGQKKVFAVEPYFKLPENEKIDNNKDGVDDNLKKYLGDIGIQGKNNTELEKRFNGLLRLNYNNMINSIKKWGGFYIARYEASGNDANKIVKEGSRNSIKNWFGDWNLLNNWDKNVKNNDIYTNMLYGVQLELVNKFIDKKVVIDFSGDSTVYKYFYSGVDGTQILDLDDYLNGIKLDKDKLINQETEKRFEEKQNIDFIKYEQLTDEQKKVYDAIKKEVAKITGITDYAKVSNIYDLVRREFSKFTKCGFRL